MIEILDSVVGQAKKSFATLEYFVQTLNEISQEGINTYSSLLSFHVLRSMFNLIMLTNHFI